VIGDLREEAKDVAGQIREGLERARATVEQLGVAGRVYARLRWDKALSGAAISVDVPKDGLAVLRGTVPNEAAMKKAVELAFETVGVEQVRNDLRVAQAAARPPSRSRR
jgi:osmotically-inducible protein OsmY